MTTAKQVLSLDDQLLHLENNKNLEIPDRDYARLMLKQIGYFSLISGYKAPFKNPTTKKYRDGVTFEDIVAFDNEFTEDIVRQNRWKSFVKKKKTIENVSFENTIALVKEVLMPIVQAIKSDSKYDKIWSCEEKRACEKISVN